MTSIRIFFLKYFYSFLGMKEIFELHLKKKKKGLFKEFFF